MSKARDNRRRRQRAREKLARWRTAQTLSWAMLGGLLGEDMVADVRRSHLSIAVTLVEADGCRHRLSGCSLPAARPRARARRSSRA